MPNAYPKEFCGDVVRVFEESDATIAQVAKDFGVAASCLQRWLAHDEEASRGSDSAGSGRPAASESAELREAKKWIWLLEQENGVLRKAAAYFAQANSPGK